jgi:hypothetical protein
MTHTISVLFDGAFSITSIAAFAVVGFVAGFLMRLAINAKQKKRMLKLENEMLSNHSQILTLEKKIGWLERENAELMKTGVGRTATLKVS